MQIEKTLEMTAESAISLRPATFADLSAAVVLFNHCSNVMIGRDEVEEEEIELEWHTPGFDLEKSTLVGHTSDGQLVAYVEVWDIAEVPVTPWIWGRVHPDFERRGIGRRLMKWAERRARMAVSRVPSGARVAFQAGTVSSYLPPQRLFEARDMSLIRRFYEMEIELDGEIPKPVWPNGIRIVSYADLPELRKVYRAFDDAFQDHWGHVQRPEEDGVNRWRHWTESDKRFDPTLWFLALDGDEIAGTCLCKQTTAEDPEMGHVNVLGVRRPWRRQGIALSMLHHAFRTLLDRGQKRVSLGVDASSLTGATKLYQKAGMHVSREYLTYEKVLRDGEDLRTRSLES